MSSAVTKPTMQTRQHWVAFQNMPFQITACAPQAKNVPL